MAKVKVYSKSPISHTFKLDESGSEHSYTIYGLNAISIGSSETEVYTEMEKATFDKIKKKYSNHPVFLNFYFKKESEEIKDGTN